MLKKQIYRSKMTYTSRKLATLVFCLNDWPALRACPVRSDHTTVCKQTIQFL